MELTEQCIEVRFAYPVHFTRELFALDNPVFAEVTRGDASQRRRLFTVVDAGVARCHPALIDRLGAYCRARCAHLEPVGEPLVVPGGEAAKNDPALVTAVHEAIARHGIDRHSFVCAIGGGAVLDMVGYAVATAHRGVRLLRVPTTVLAQNDAGVGVKNSVNAFGKKNFLGTFAPPHAVLSDLSLLTTLDERDWRAGLAEAVKVALLRDAGFLEALERDAAALRARELEAMTRVVVRCAQLHLEHIRSSGDPFELGSSRPLDFGHWAAHRLESLSGYALRHGEAVAIGICLDATISMLEGRLSQASWQRILCLFAALGLARFDEALEAHLEAPEHPRGLLRGLDEFREHLGGQLTVMLLEDAPGGGVRGVEVHHIEPELVRRAVHCLRAATHPDSGDVPCPATTPSAAAL